MPSIEIKRATIEDAQLISDLSTVTFIETYRGNCPDEDLTNFMDKCFNEEVITGELNDANDFYYIAFADGFPVGYMRLKEDDANYPLEKKYKAIHLKRIYVLKEYHSRKIGAALMQFALQLANEKNYEMMWLGVWEHNKKAMQFYEDRGFKDINKSYTFYVGGTIDTDRWMVKFIEKT